MRNPRSLLVVGLAIFIAAGACVGGSMTVAQRFAAVHNVLGPAGFAQLGPISEGELAQGQAADIPLPLTARQCYSITAFGGPGVWDINAELLDGDGVPLASDGSRSPQASLHYCAERSGRHMLRVTVASGAGDYAVGVWSAGGGASAFSGTGGGGGGGPCDAPATLALGGSARGSTQGGSDNIVPACVNPGDSQAPDAVYQVTVEQRGMLRVELQSQFDGVVSLLSECVGDPGAAIVCNDDLVEGDTSRSGFEATVEPGTYFVVVDGYGAEAGTYSLSTDFSVLRDIAEVCAELPVLTPGVEIEGTTVGQGDDFRTNQECAAGSRAPDVAYQLVIERTSRVRLHLQSDYDGVLALRRDCAQESSELACNDDFGEGDEARRASQIVTQLEPGTYTVIVDGYEGEEGTFRLTGSVAAVGESSAANDVCARAATLAPDQDAAVDTFVAADDYRGSCITEPGAPDVVYQVTVDERSLLSASATGGDMPDPVLYLQRTCGDADSEIACGTRQVSSVLTPGTYFLVVDGARRDTVGSTNLRYELVDIGPLDAVCSDAPVLAAGETTRSTTTGTSRFEASCGEGARGPERIFSLRVRERSRVEISVEAEFDSVLYVRRDCVDPGTTVDCNDDAGDSNHSALDLELEPGTYYVFVDGYGEGGESGPFTIRAEVTPR
jgi:hypothetical protein